MSEPCQADPLRYHPCGHAWFPGQGLNAPMTKVLSGGWTIAATREKTSSSDIEQQNDLPKKSQAQPAWAKNFHGLATLLMDRTLSCVPVPPPVALIGNRTGQVMTHPTTQIMTAMRKKRRKRYESRL
jgi:hypothetical protein